MNFEKNRRHALKLAKEQKHLRKKAKKGHLTSEEQAKASWNIEIDNYAPREVIQAESAFDRTVREKSEQYG